VGKKNVLVRRQGSQALSALAHNFKAQNRQEELGKLKDIFTLIPGDQMPEFVRKNLAELIRLTAK
jgi:hypothetical protein